MLKCVNYTQALVFFIVLNLYLKFFFQIFRPPTTTSPYFLNILKWRIDLLRISLFLLYYGLSCIGDFLKILSIFSVLIKAINITIYHYIWTLSMCNYSFWTSMMIHCVRYEEKWWCYIMILPSSDIAIMPYLYYIATFYCLTLNITLFGIFPPTIFSFK